MKIKALKFLTQPPRDAPRRSYLDAEGKEEFDRTIRADVPSAYVVRSTALETIRKFTDVVVDCGKKNESKGLVRYLLGKDRIPLIRGSYKDPGQLKRSVRTLLSNAAARGERNVYLIGTDDAVFQAGWEEAGRVREAAKRAGADGPDDASVTIRLLDLLGCREEPPGLARKYIGKSTEAKLVRQLILHAAESDCTVLILGDTGTGKEIVAGAIHQYSREFSRRSGELVAVNCGAIPGELLESELFGYEEGAFTGARKGGKPGKVEKAAGGTLFLDEIGDLPLAHQVKILRVLQEKEVVRVGGTISRRVDVRVIAATNRDLFSMVQAKQFRKDLYYRLREFLIRTPSLRDHPDDIPVLAQALWQENVARNKESFLSPAILRELQTLRWPGNARELKMVLMNMQALFGKKDLRPEHLRAVFLFQGQAPAPGPDSPVRRSAGLHRIECLNHLRRVEEVVLAGKKTIDLLLDGRKGEAPSGVVIEDLVLFRLGELEVLCQKPLLFHDKDIFSMVHGLKGNLFFFKDLMREKDPREALHYLKDTVVKDIRRVRQAIGREIEVLLSGTS